MKCFVGSILYKYSKDDCIEMLRIIKIHENDNIDILKLNNNKIIRNIPMSKIKGNYNILKPHIVISHVKCEDCDRLFVKTDRKSDTPNYIYDGNLGYHYSVSSQVILGIDYIRKVSPSNINKLCIYYIDDIRELLNFISDNNSLFSKMNTLVTDELIESIYMDNNIVIDKDSNIKCDNNKTIVYHIGMNTDSELHQIVHGKNGIFLIK